jgi:serine kinase of HPr protein (carbohydrate metabolism regulator)
MTRQGEAVHGTAFLIGDVGLLAIGRSGSGKSSLVTRLAAAVRPGDAPVRLVADDRVRLSAAHGRIVARPVDGFLGKIELRGLGIADAPAMPSAVIRAVIRLDSGQPDRIPEQPLDFEELLGVPLPLIHLRKCDDSAQELLAKWPYLRRMIHKE